MSSLEEGEIPLAQTSNPSSANCAATPPRPSSNSGRAFGANEWQGLQFYRQKPLANYIIDFYCAVARLVIELDGDQHFEPDARADDAQRTRSLEALDLQVLRFDNRQMLSEMDEAMKVIDEMVKAQVARH